MPRNRELMRVFRDMELVEQIGSGLSLILKVYDRKVFTMQENGVLTMSLFAHFRVNETPNMIKSFFN